MPIKYIGRTTDFAGKTLWEILGNLKGYGVGRLLYRQRFQRYPEPCYFKILKVQPVQHDGNLENPHENYRKVMVYVASVFRGVLEPEVQEIFATSYKPDYRLIPKHEEQEWLRRTGKGEKKIQYIDPWVDMPPLLKKVVARDLELENKTPEPNSFRMKVSFLETCNNLKREADENHPADIKIESFFGTPLSPELYEIKPEVAEYFKQKKPY
ncbi:28S ribosomal protein S34, mitochondrial [Diaphorina citri]|uniref:28S ribosomal protein S34, mitochondrial n=1 Tax=Diaphorina citri TaxID=121845 RepID=A0A1S3D1D4_DIACI|nr:28S ribosomal protein S34, mitochondrial-like [Diaphorina citri]XP_008472256.1 28S ribosomal protein S34, mitochondrial [Diaphorina citri]KAI5697643.1 hypothetical protein M8J75_013511 [Diaphorina citri]KAI5719486.1 hypothetical protein M8J76_010906 [Diaphorina citri]KAI5721213.1 hypothetical protein M8J77_017597 [Diaphorina citri]